MTTPKLTKLRRIDFTGMAIVGGLTLIGLLQVIHPHLQAQQIVAAQRIDLADQRRRATESASSVDQFKKRLHTLQQQIETGPNKLLHANQINRRLVELNELATKEGLNIRNLQPGGTTSLPRFQIVQIDLIGTGTYRSESSFLHHLHEVFPDMGVNSFELSIDPAEPTVSSFHFNLAWYVRPK